MEGEVLIYRAALGILKLYQAEFLKADFEAAVRLMKAIDLKNFDDNRVMDSIFSIRIQSIYSSHSLIQQTYQTT
jgi:hypothetical protein